MLISGVAFADQVVLTNGDTVTGAVIKKDGAKLTIHSEFLGDVTMPWTAVKSLRSDEALTVVLPSGESVSGKVATAGANLEVATASGVKTAPLADVSAVRNPAEQHSWDRLQHPGLLELWTGFFDFGLALARGNARTDTQTTSFNATRVTRKDKITLNFKQIRGTSRVNNETSLVAAALRGGWTYNRDLTPRLFVAAFNDYEHDQFQDLKLRFVVGGGLGINAVKTDRTVLSFQGGADYEHESFSNSVSRSSGELNFGNDLLFKLSGLTSLTQSFRMFPNLTDTGEYRVNFDLGAVTTIKKWLGWQVTASDRFLSNPLFGRQRNDLLLSTGLRLSFAR
jgi:putative salt-induced outer membrane protein YdiY